MDQDRQSGGAADSPEPLRLAFAHHLAGRRAEAEGVCRELLQRQPGHAGALQLLGLMAQQQGRLEVALKLMRMAVAAGAGVADYHNSLGTVLADLKRFDEALAAFDRAVRLRPGYAEAYRNRGIALAKAGRLAEAMGPLREAVRLRPDDSRAWEELVLLHHQLGDLPAMIDCRRRIVALRPDDPAALGELLVTLHYSPDYSPGQLLEEHRVWSRKFEKTSAPGECASAGRRDSGDATGQRAEADSDNEADEARPGTARLEGGARTARRNADPIRVGYVSGDFREHPAARFVLPVLRAHDRNRVQAVCYSDVGRQLPSGGAARPDRLTEKFRAAADVWRDSSDWSDEQLANAVRADGIDVLVDMAGHLDSRRLTLFARRPAPVQAGYFGYPGTTGTACIGWRITDGWLDPPGDTERFHSETLLRIPGGCWCYDPGDDVLAAAARELPAISRGHVTFAAFNRLIKVTPAMGRLWAEVLERTPGSKLAVLASPGEGFERAAADRLSGLGIDRHRLIVLPRRSRREYLACYNSVDLALDTAPYAGMTTTCDALWMGVPTVTLEGSSCVARTGVSLASTAGLPELIAPTPARYADAAVALARDLPRLADLRAGLRQRVAASPLADAGRVSRALEEAYGRMLVEATGVAR